MKATIYIPKRSSVLVIEDGEARLDWFHKKLAHVKTAYGVTPFGAENMAARANSFDIVFLDHDAVPELISADNPHYDELTFYKAAEELARQRFDGTVIIHSHNPVGARRMAHLLERTAHVQVLPFGMFDIEVQ